jgi:hypothetical protein
MGRGMATADGSTAAEHDKKALRWSDVLAVAVPRSWRERVLARQTSRESLRVYREVEEAHPELTGPTRYKAVVARQTGLDEADVETILERAEMSFASWPVERPLKFRDVVQYLVVHQHLNANPAALGVCSRLTTIIAEEIPQEL